MNGGRVAKLGSLALAVVLARCQPHSGTSREAGSRAIDAGVSPRPISRPRDASADGGPPAIAPGPTGTIEGTVFLDGPIRRGPPIQVASTWATHPGCRDAALRYAQPFDVTQPGPFPGALVFADAHERSPRPPEDRRMVFRDCDIIPRAMFVQVHDHILFHPDTRLQVLPHVVGAGAAIDRLLIPGQEDVPVHVPGPGIFPVTVRTLPDWVGARLYVLANRFIDTTDTTGHYRITEVPPGHVLVHAWYPGTVETHIIVDVRPNEVAHADFHIHEAPPRPTPPPVTGPVPP